ncbi:hypothetical protein PDIG_83890 [Penicillium digitatum PHI26]|uniref:Uncharacterized protein n=2 Tax=Penicillium digitatum TaxID=36651 RepID=K9F7T3_PEND2|nr:hypothetical protein PDIP_89380 [Penicillium digitatum Pd1]EKV04032.1 hypothetical protein PDIP_89380 [Penicillium digitatum Pd1]EKV05410.1 hypothetical protein PDIG_83890 [Penicillium digitatum PHI26]
MYVLSVYVGSIPVSASRHPAMSDVSNSPDTKCFEALPLDTFKAIGSSESIILRMTREHRRLHVKVAKYLFLLLCHPKLRRSFLRVPLGRCD